MLSDCRDRRVAFLVFERFECSVVRIAHLFSIDEQVRSPLSPASPDHFLSLVRDARVAR